MQSFSPFLVDCGQGKLRRSSGTESSHQPGAQPERLLRYMIIMYLFMG